MTVEEQSSYYSKHFNIICEKEPKILLEEPTYKLDVLLNPGPGLDDGPILIDSRNNLNESELDQALEELKEKTYLTLEV